MGIVEQIEISEIILMVGDESMCEHPNVIFIDPSLDPTDAFRSSYSQHTETKTFTWEVVGEYHVGYHDGCGKALGDHTWEDWAEHLTEELQSCCDEYQGNRAALLAVTFMYYCSLPL